MNAMSAGSPASFLALWMAMMVPMMLPSLAPALWRYRQAVAEVRAGRPSALALAAGAGLVQIGPWKRRQLAGCRACADACVASAVSASAAWLHGMHLGVRCVLCCGNLMAIVLVTGMMDRWVMAGVTAAVTLERVARKGAAWARASGVVLTGAGMWLIARALGG